MCGGGAITIAITRFRQAGVTQSDSLMSTFTWHSLSRGARPSALIERCRNRSIRPITSDLLGPHCVTGLCGRKSATLRNKRAGGGKRTRAHARAVTHTHVHRECGAFSSPALPLSGKNSESSCVLTSLILPGLVSKNPGKLKAAPGSDYRGGGGQRSDRERVQLTFHFFSSLFFTSTHRCSMGFGSGFCDGRSMTTLTWLSSV